MQVREISGRERQQRKKVGKGQKEIEKDIESTRESVLGIIVGID